MEITTMNLVILAGLFLSFVQNVSSLGYTYGYSPYYGSLGGYGGYGSCGGYGTYGGYGGYGCSSYPCNYGHSYAPSCLSPCCLKAKLLKSCLALKKPCLLPKPCLPKPFPCLPCLHKTCLPCLQKPCLPCLRKPCLTSLRQPSACIKTDACFKYPTCGPCPYASFQPRCLKHKATLALCSA